MLFHSILQFLQLGFVWCAFFHLFFKMHYLLFQCHFLFIQRLQESKQNIVISSFLSNETPRSPWCTNFFAGPIGRVCASWWNPREKLGEEKFFSVQHFGLSSWGWKVFSCAILLAGLVAGLYKCPCSQARERAWLPKEKPLRATIYRCMTHTFSSLPV